MGTCRSLRPFVDPPPVLPEPSEAIRHIYGCLPAAASLPMLSSDDQHRPAVPAGSAVSPASSPLRSAVSSLPERVLDAPGLHTGFHQAMAWRDGFLAVALGPSVFLWEESSGAVFPLSPSASPASPIISCIHWMLPARGKSAPSPYKRGILAVGDSTGELSLWDPFLLRKIRALPSLGSSSVFSMSSCSYILSVSYASSVACHYDTRKKETPVAIEGSFSALSWRESDGSVVAMGMLAGSISVWQREGLSGSPVTMYQGHIGPVQVHLSGCFSLTLQSIAWCPWQLNLVASCDPLEIHIWNSSTGACIRKTRSAAALFLAWGPLPRHGSSLISVEKDDISVRSPGTLSPYLKIRNASASAVSCCLAGQHCLVIAGSDERIRFRQICAGGDRKYSSGPSMSEAAEASEAVSSPAKTAPRAFFSPPRSLPPSGVFKADSGLFSPESRRALFFSR